MQVVERKRIMHFVIKNKNTQKNQKVGDVLKNLGLDKIGNGKSNLSINHNNILYK